IMEHPTQLFFLADQAGSRRLSLDGFKIRREFTTAQVGTVKTLPRRCAPSENVYVLSGIVVGMAGKLEAALDNVCNVTQHEGRSLLALVFDEYPKPPLAVGHGLLHAASRNLTAQLVPANVSKNDWFK